MIKVNVISEEISRLDQLYNVDEKHLQFGDRKLTDTELLHLDENYSLKLSELEKNNNESYREEPWYDEGEFINLAYIVQRIFAECIRSGEFLSNEQIKFIIYDYWIKEPCYSKYSEKDIFEQFSIRYLDENGPYYNKLTSRLIRDLEQQKKVNHFHQIYCDESSSMLALESRIDILKKELHYCSRALPKWRIAYLKEKVIPIIERLNNENDVYMADVLLLIAVYNFEMKDKLNEDYILQKENVVRIIEQFIGTDARYEKYTSEEIYKKVKGMNLFRIS